MERAKQLGFSDSQLAYLWELTTQRVKELEKKRASCQPLKQLIHVPQNLHLKLLSLLDMGR